MKLEKKADEVEFTETPIENTNPYIFTEQQQETLNEFMDRMRANHVLAQDLAKINFDISKQLHDYIQNIHPELKDVIYNYEPKTHNIQLRKPQ